MIREIHFLVGLDDLSKHKVEHYLEILLKSYENFKCNLIHKLVLCFPDDYDIPNKYLKYNIFRFKYKSKTKCRYDNMYYAVEYLEKIPNTDIFILEPDMVFTKKYYLFDKKFIDKIHMYSTNIDYSSINEVDLKLQFELTSKEYDKLYVFSGAFFPRKYQDILKEVLERNEELNTKYNNTYNLTFVAFYELLFNDYFNKENFSEADYISYNYEKINSEILFMHSKDINILRSSIEK